MSRQRDNLHVQEYAPDWPIIHYACGELARRLPTNLLGVAAVSRGGLAPAAIMAHALNLNEVVLADTNWCPRELDHRWVIIDDLIDSAATFIDLQKRWPHAWYAAIFNKLTIDQLPPGLGMGRVVWYERRPQQEWVLFPWEREITRQYIITLEGFL